MIENEYRFDRNEYNLSETPNDERKLKEKAIDSL